MKKNNKIDMKRTLNFFEELTWLLDNNKNIDFQGSIKEMRYHLQNQGNSSILEQHTNMNNTSKRALIGIFPELFQDTTLFPNVASLIDFSNEVLHTNISSAKKRSRTETIGQIICETLLLNDADLHVVECALIKLIDNDYELENIKIQRVNNQFSWNNIIKKLSEDIDE